jgi:hypothetical protein
MDEIQLTQLFIEYAETRKKLDKLEADIKAEILVRKESSKIAGVTATFYKASDGTPKYEDAVVNYIGENPDKKEELKQFQEVTISTAWKDACGYFSLTPQPGEGKPARVVVK